MSQHYDTEYADQPGFKPKLEANDRIIKEEYFPQLELLGFRFPENRFDASPLQLTPEQQADWIEPLQPRNGIRGPDLLSLDCDLVKVKDSASKQVFFEIKDFPQENNFLMQGIPYRNVRTYIAVQHLLGIPVFALFRDNAKQEAGTDRLTPYVSAFKDNGRYLVYGDLLFDMYLRRGRSYDVGQSNDKQEIRWQAQQERDGSMPCMKPISAIARMLGDGKIRKVKADPTDLPLWKFIQEQSVKMNEPQLKVPEGGLIYFTAK